MKLDELTERQRQTAFKRLRILQDVASLRMEGKPLKEVLPNVGITKASYHRWRKAYDEGGVEGLADRCNERRGGKRTIPDTHRAFLVDKLLREERPHVMTIFKTDYLYFCDSISERRVSYSTFLRAFNDIPEAAKIKYRLGKKAYDDTQPFIVRDLNALKALEVAQSDHYQMDIPMIGSNGKPVFPWVTWWMDLGSRFPLGYCLTEKPNQDTINYSLFLTIKNYGVPSIVYVDQGKDYKSKIFTGITSSGKRFNEFKMEVDELALMGIYNKLQIKTIFATAYNAKAKAIEPAHRTLHNLERRYYGYRGTNPKDRTGYMQGKIKGGGELNPSRLPNRTEMEARLGEIMKEYSSMPHTGLNKQEPRDVFNTKFKRIGLDKISIDESALKLLMLKVANKFYKVYAQGIKFRGEWYYADWLMIYEGGKVGVRYDPRDVDNRGNVNYVHIYDEKDGFLEVAPLRAKAPAVSAKSEIFSDLGRQKRLRSLYIDEYKKTETSILQRLAEGDMRGLPSS